MNAGSGDAGAAPRPSVFLSYASQDRAAAQAIRDTLAAAGLEAWLDETALDGGDAWDQKIRRQIRECDYFMPVISAQTEARSEGYFRREWRFAVERTLDMADDHLFLLPIVIDDTSEAQARVPDRFLAVQWTRMPGGQSTPAFENLCRRLAAHQTSDLGMSRSAYRPPRGGHPPLRDATGSASTLRADARVEAAALPAPDFPQADPKQGKVAYFAQILAWAVRSGWAAFKQLPKWIRITAYAFLAIWLMRSCDTYSNDSDRHARKEKVSAAQAGKLKDLADQLSDADTEKVAKLSALIAKQFPETGASTNTAQPFLAIPFMAPADDPFAKALANTTFTQVYGRVAIARKGKVSLPTDPSAVATRDEALARARAQHASFVLYGAVDPKSTPKSLTIEWLEVSDGSVSWSGSYPVAGSDAAHIAAEVESETPTLDD